MMSGRNHARSYQGSQLAAGTQAANAERGPGGLLTRTQGRRMGECLGRIPDTAEERHARPFDQVHVAILAMVRIDRVTRSR